MPFASLSRLINRRMLSEDKVTDSYLLCQSQKPTRLHRVAVAAQPARALDAVKLTDPVVPNEHVGNPGGAREGEEGGHRRSMLGAHLWHPWLMPRPRRAHDPDERKGALSLAKAPARRSTRTPEAIAKTVIDRDPSPPGQLEKAEITLRLVLPRAVLERLRARAIREGRRLEAVVAELLGDK